MDEPDRHRHPPSGRIAVQVDAGAASHKAASAPRRQSEAAMMMKQQMMWMSAGGRWCTCSVLLLLRLIVVISCCCGVCGDSAVIGWIPLSSSLHSRVEGLLPVTFLMQASSTLHHLPVPVESGPPLDAARAVRSTLPSADHAAEVEDAWDGPATSCQCRTHKRTQHSSSSRISAVHAPCQSMNLC